ncbi:MAG: hypothetical protein V4642_03440 [Bacteroidota bacterium]
MSEEKLTPTRLVFIPFLIISILFPVIYSLLHWLLLTNYEIFEFDILVDYFLPILLALGLYVVFINSRIDLLDHTITDNVHYDGGKFLFIIAAIGITVPTIILQKTVHEIAGKITELGAISEIKQHRPTKYYNLKSYFIEKNYPGIYTNEWNYKLNTNFDVYIVAPILNSAQDTNLPKYDAWIGKIYRFDIDKNENSKVKEQAFESFTNKSIESFKNSTFTGFNHLERMRQDVSAYQLAAYQTDKADTEPIIFEAKFEPFEARAEGDLELCIFIYCISTAAFFFLTYNKPFNKYRLSRFLKIPYEDQRQPVRDPNYKSKKRRNRSQNL